MAAITGITSMNVFRLTHIDHCTLIVTNIAKSRQFYGEFLGLREIAPPQEFDFVAIWYDLGGQYLHLLQKPVPDTLSPRHICFHVDHLDHFRAHCLQHGVAIDETVKIAAAERFFIRDPDGNRLEILHWLRPYQPTEDGRTRV